MEKEPSQGKKRAPLGGTRASPSRKHSPGLPECSHAPWSRPDFWLARYPVLTHTFTCCTGTAWLLAGQARLHLLANTLKIRLVTYSSSTTLSLSSVWPSWYLDIYTLLKTEICIHPEKVRVAPRCGNRMGTSTISTHCSGTLTIEDSEDASPIHTLSSGEAILHIIADDKRRSYNPGRRISSYLLQSTLIKNAPFPLFQSPGHNHLRQPLAVSTKAANGTWVELEEKEK